MGARLMAVRIIAGEFGGRILHTLKGGATRPTSDRVKESLFSSLDSTLGGFEGLIVFDAFGGSGGLGLEALSRGASFVVFSDSSREAAATIKKNIAALKVGERTQVLPVKAEKIASMKLQQEPFDLVFLDPPYKMNNLEVIEIITSLTSAGKLSRDSHIVYERAQAQNAPKTIELTGTGLSLNLLRSKKYGESMIDVYQLTPNEF